MRQPAPSNPVAIATARTPGIDVARALAVFGMVFVNYQSMIDAAHGGPWWLAWSIERIEGRAAALFVILAGIGISLRSKRARENPAKYLSYERSALLKRAGVLFVVGVLILHVWEWDILHCYGLFLAFASLLLRVRARWLGLLAAAFVAVEVVLHARFVYHVDLSFWTLRGALTDLLFNGLHPVFPWMAFLLGGMWLGRLDLNETRLRRRLIAGGVLAAVVGETVAAVAGRAPHLLGLSEDSAVWLSSWPRPPHPVFVLAAAGTAVALLALCVEITRKRAQKRWVVALTATGQLAFTLYVAHVIAIVVPVQHGYLVDGSLFLSVGYSAAFCAAAVAVSVWWRKRMPYGPLEGLIRQITGRTSPAPWGGEPIEAPDPPRR